MLSLYLYIGLYYYIVLFYWLIILDHFLLVHPTDAVRIDLKIPPDQYIYLRAATPAERQQWLVALGTAKACLTTMQHNGHSEMPGECKSMYMYMVTS